jgi:hypothetical protein
VAAAKKQRNPSKSKKIPEKRTGQTSTLAFRFSFKLFIGPADYELLYRLIKPAEENGHTVAGPWPFSSISKGWPRFAT